MAESGKVHDKESNVSLPDTLELDLEEIDDTEFDIPPVEKTPTLESILNELEDQGSLSDEEISPLLQVGESGYAQDGGETLSLASRGSSDARSRGSSTSRNRRRSPGRLHGPGSILRHVILKGISSQLNSANERVNAGTPTAMAVSAMIAVGTSHGLVLVFDTAQALKWCLGSSAVGDESGAVSSLGFNHDCSRILVGFAKGHILMYDLTNGKLLRTLTDVHPPGTAVLHVKFTDSPTLALCSDSGGSVFELNFKRTMGVRGCDSRCLFSGSRGEVVTIEPLLLHQFGTHPLHHVVIVAMATLSKVIVVTIRPRMRVLFTHSLQSSPTTLPLLAWQFVIIQVADSSRVIDPVLAFGRDSTFYFFQVSVDIRSKIRLIPLQKTNVNYHLLSLQWLNTRTLAVLDTREQLHLVDVRTQQELEVIDLSDVKLVYGSSHFKGLATGGNVSKALALSGEKACYNSIVSFGNQMLILGTRSFHVLTIRLWSDRLSHLIKQNKYVDALSLGMAFYEDRGKAVVGLKGPKPRRKELIKEKIIEILNKYIDEVLSKPRESVTRETYEEVIVAGIMYCVSLGELELLYGKFFEAASINPIALALYLEGLEPYILNDQLVSVPPSIMQQFVVHYENKGYLQAVEACIVHLEVSSIDIHQTMTLCWQHNLYDAILYIYNRGMMDYVTPFEELITVLQNALATGKQLSDAQITLGNKLLVYVSCCLAGRAYPLGDIPPDQVQSVKHEIFKCLIQIHSKNAPDSELTHPYLRALLHFDTREFLNVLALAFEEPEFTSELGLRQRQRVVDILLLIMVHGDGFTASQVGSLFTFLARQLARPGSGLVVEQQLFAQVVEFLTSAGTGELVGGGQHEERQQALLELLRAPGGLLHYEPDQLLDMARKAKFFRVCELLYEKRKEYDKILYCYLQDPLRKPQVFSYLRNILVNPGYVDKETTQKQLVENIQDLVDIDNKKTGQIVYVHLPQCMTVIIENLQSQPDVLYNFLQGLFTYKESHSGYNQNKEEYPIDPVVYETYISLMCEHQPALLCGYIKSTEGYRLDETLEIVKQHKQLEATAYLLEKAGDIHGAFDLLLNELKTEVKNVTQGDEGSSEVAWSRLSAHVVVLVQLCQRGASLLDEKGREQLWFPLLDCLMEPRRTLFDKLPPEHMQTLKELTHHLLSSMMGYVSLPAVIQIILQDPAYSGGKFGEIRELLISMLENSSYEETLLQTTSRILSSDLHEKLARLMLQSRRPLAPRAALPTVSTRAIPRCCHCAQPLATSPTHTSLPASTSTLLFKCGHAFHVSCLPESGGRDEYVCRLCSPAAGFADTSSKSSPASDKNEELLKEQFPRPQKSPTKELLTAEQMRAVNALRTSQQCGVEVRTEATSSSTLSLNLAPPPERPNLKGLF